MNNTSTKKSRFGAMALIVAVFSIISLGAFFAVAYLNITPHTFFRWNNILAALYCVTAPLSAIFSALGLFSTNDSKPLSWTALGIAAIPFLFLFWQFVAYFVNSAQY